jgi:hypothetical protein
MTHPILPKLRKDHTVGNFNAAGVWDVRGPQGLDDLSKGLAVDPIETQINSIPDMWARPLLFEMALTDVRHVLHERILGEWRGLLAMLALKEVALLSDLEAIRVDITGTPVNENRDFLATLAKLLPTASLAEDTTWNSLYLFLFDRRPIGMTSPTTLVVTATDYLNRIRGVRWYDGVRLVDPKDVLHRKQKQALAAWLDMVRNKISQHESIDADRLDPIVRLLRDFQDDLEVVAAEFRGGNSLGITGHEAGVFGYLDRPFESSGEGVKDSEVCLISSADRNPNPSKALLLVDHTVANQWKRPAHDIVVYDTLTLDQIPFSGLGQNHSQLGPLQLQGAEWRTVRELFTDKLFVIAQENAFRESIEPNYRQQPLTYTGAIVTPLLPLRKELISYLSPDELNQRIFLEATPGGIKAHLRLTLSGGEYEAEKLYAPVDIVRIDNLPILEIWPNFSAQGWKAYFTCYYTDNVEATFEAEPYSPGSTNLQPKEAQRVGKKRHKTWYTGDYPEAMLCQAVVLNSQTNIMELQEAGMILLRPPQAIKPQGKTFRVGIDFGATSTNVYVRDGDIKLPVNFQDRRSSVTASGAEEQLFDLFLPKGQVDMPFLSLFHDFLIEPQAHDLQPFLNGHIYFLHDYRLLKAPYPGMATDLKWSDVPQDRVRVKAFLTQLALQTAAEAVAKGANSINWAFSYPTAFSENQIEGFPGIWDQVTQKCAELTGILRPETPGKQTESLAAALFFLEQHKASPQHGTIFIDIGGSTSDVSIWQGSKPLWQTSLRLAGRDMFLNFLWINPDFLAQLGMDVANLVTAKSQNDLKSFYAHVDALLRQESTTLFRKLATHGGAAGIKPLRQHLALGLSGLLYYIGSVLNNFISRKKYRQETPHVYVGGNGSQMFRWLDIDGDGKSNKLYKKIFARGAGWTGDEPFNVILSSAPKAEAAYGLVCDMNLDLNAESDRTVIAGESFYENGRAQPWSQALTAERFTKTLEPPQTLEHLEDFLAGFNEFANREGLIEAWRFDNSLWMEVRRRLAQTLSHYRGQANTADIVVEPIFILALKHLLEISNGM